MTAYGPPAWVPPAPEPMPEPPEWVRDVPPVAEERPEAETATETRPDLFADHDAEREVLAAVLVSPPLLEEARARLGRDDWADAHHRGIFGAMCAVADADGDPSNPHALLRELTKLGTFPATAWLSAIGAITERQGTTTHFPRYVDAVAEASQRRQVRDLGEIVAVEAAAPPGDHGDWLDGVAERLERIVETRSTVQLRSISSGLAATLERLEQANQASAYTGGVTLPWSDLRDKVELGNGHLVVLSGNPGSGKTSGACQIADHVAEHHGRVHVFSLEMPEHEFLCRMMAQRGRVNYGNLRRGEVADEDWPRLTMAVDDLSRLPLQYSAEGQLTMGQIRAAVMRAVRRGEGPRLVVIDYLQRIRARGARTREEEVGGLARDAKSLAKDAGCCVLLLSSLSRGAKQGRPTMGDLRGSGEIEFEADAVMLLYRATKDAASVDWIIDKNRHGESQTSVTLVFDGPACRFDSPSIADDYRVGRM